jgi:serine/threonine-protein phosphatase 2B catalytic subunit
MLSSRRGEIIGKIQSVGRLMRMFQTLRREQESIVLLKDFGNGTIKKGLLLEGKDAIKNALSEFQNSMEMDKPNLQRCGEMESRGKKKIIIMIIIIIKKK